MRRRRPGRRGVSDVVATILLLALTVTLFAAIFAWVVAFPAPTPQNNNQFRASLTYTSNGLNISSVQITHLAGPSISGTAQIYLKSAIQPSAPEFSTPYTVASQTLSYATVSGFSSWNLGQTWVVTFTNTPADLPSSLGNITVYVVSSQNLLFSVILPGAAISVAPTVVSTWTTPATPTIGGAFTVNATLAGGYNPAWVYVNLASIPGASGKVEAKMTENSQGVWGFKVNAGNTSSATAGTYYGFVNTTSSTGQGATGAVVITIISSGGVVSPASLTVSPTSGVPGGTVTPGAAGTNFGPVAGISNVTLSLGGFIVTPTFTGTTTGACPGSGTTIQIQSGSTSFTCVFTVPSGVSYGSLALVAYDSTSGQTAAVSFTASPPLATASAPTVSTPFIDRGQTPVAATDTLPATLGGVSPVTYTWLVSYDSGAYAAATATQCTTPSGTASNGEVVTCVPATTVATGTYSYEMQLTDSETPAVTTTSAASGTVTVNTALTAPAAPTVSATKLDVDQTLTVTVTIPSTGTPTYSWQWLVSINGGAYAAATQCASSSGGGAAGGATETCSIAGNTLTAGDNYAFEVRVTDSATTAETTTSAASATVTVSTKLTAPATPTVVTSGTTQTVTGTIPSTGTATYSWTWLVSINGAAFATATQCTHNSGSGAAAGATETCAASGLSTTKTYSWELQVTDSATTPETATSAASAATDGSPASSPIPTDLLLGGPLAGSGQAASVPMTSIVWERTTAAIAPSTVPRLFW